MDVSKPYDILTVHSCISPIYKFLVLAGSLGSAVLGPESLPSTHTLGKSRGKGSMRVAEWTQGLKVPPRPPTQLLAMGPQDPSLCWKDPVEAQPVPVCLPPPGLAPPPRQPPLPEGTGERVPCQSEVLKSWTHLVQHWTHCSQLWTCTHIRVGVCMQSLLAARCAMPLALLRPCQLYPEVSFIEHRGVWGSV